MIISKEIISYDSYGVSVQGEHTPGFNSDNFTIVEPVGSNLIKSIALIADGVTGNGVDRNILAGKALSSRLVQHLPTLFLEREDWLLRDPEGCVSESIAAIASFELGDIENINLDPEAQIDCYQQHFYAASTLIGLVRLQDRVITFCSGDSNLCLFGQQGPTHSTIFTPNKDSVGGLKSSIVCNINNGLMKYNPDWLSLQVNKLNTFDSNLAIMCSDGLYSTSTVSELMWYIAEGSNSLNLKEICLDSIRHSDSLDNYFNVFLDDKTIIALKL